jgi:hypothetical protein
MKTLNTDDIFLRNLTIALLDLLNGEMVLTLARDDHKEQFSVPFVYNYGTDEGFLKDFYIGLPDNCRIPVAEGTYDIIPRGIVTLSSFQIKSSDITNKFVRGSFTQTEKGDNDQNVLTGYSAQLFSLPLAVKFDVKIICDNLNKAFKIAESMLNINYSNRVVYFQYNGVRIPAQFQFPATETVDKQYKFTLVDNNKINVTLSIEVETYFPSFESTSKRKSSNVMERINVNRRTDSGDQVANSWAEKPAPTTTTTAAPTTTTTAAPTTTTTTVALLMNSKIEKTSTECLPGIPNSAVIVNCSLKPLDWTRVQNGTTIQLNLSINSGTTPGGIGVLAGNGVSVSGTTLTIDDLTKVIAQDGLLFYVSPQLVGGCNAALGMTFNVTVGDVNNLPGGVVSGTHEDLEYTLTSFDI